MPLYHVHDNDRPGYLIAKDFCEALEKWKQAIVNENDEYETTADIEDGPTGVMVVAEDSELIVDGLFVDQLA